MSNGKIVLAMPNIEEFFLRRFVYTPEWHHLIKYMLPGIYSTPTNKYICHAMKRLQEKGIKITKHNITLYLTKDVDVSIFRRKLKLPVVDSFDVERVLEDKDLRSISKEDSDFTIEQSYENIVDLAYRRFVSERVSDILYKLQYIGEGAVISSQAAFIARMYFTLSAHRGRIKLAKHESGISRARKSIKNANTVIPTFSSGINKFIGGWTRGYPNTLMARSQHCKSNFITNECKHKVERDLVGKIAVISVEEDNDTFWKRMFAIEFNISTTAMRAGMAEPSDEQEAILEAKYGDRVKFFNDSMAYKDIVSLIFSLRDYELIYIDHINAIRYPGSGNDLQNMIGGIPMLITREKEFLARNKEISIINVNQVAEKQLEQIRDYWKFPYHELAYGNSMSWISSREWVTLYYPYKDLANRPAEWVQVDKHYLPTNHDVYARIEKSSFTDIGETQFYFDFEHSRLMDTKSKEMGQTSIQHIQEEIFKDEILKKKR